MIVSSNLGHYILEKGEEEPVLSRPQAVLKSFSGDFAAAPPAVPLRQDPR